MKRKLTLIALVLCVIVLVLAANHAPTYAQTDGANGYTLTWSTIDGGGAALTTGGGYTLSGTAGQPDGGVLSGGGYTLAGGFWGGPLTKISPMYLPIVLRAVIGQ